jgi:hypothetical protein
MDGDGGEEAQTEARRFPPREPGQLREALAHGIRRVPQARLSNDGNLGAERQSQDAPVGGTPPSPSNDGKFAQQIPVVRERRVSSDPGRAPAAPARAALGGLPQHPRGITTPDDGRRAASPEALDAEPQTPPDGGRMPDSEAPEIGNGEGPSGGESFESAFQDGEFVGIRGGAERRAAPVRDGQEGDYAEPDGPDFETVPSPDDHSEQEAVSAKAREPAPRGSFAVNSKVTQMADPWTLEGPNPAAPEGPDYNQVRLVTQAIQKTIDQRREKRRQLAGDDDKAAVGGEGGDGQRMSDVLQNAKTHSEYLTRGKQLLKRYKRENRLRVADEDVDPREFVAFLIGLRPFVAGTTWRIYRLSATAAIQSIPHEGIEQAIATLAGKGRIEDDARVVYKATMEKGGGNTSADRAKRMDLVHFRKLRTSLPRMTRSNKVDWLDDWLVAGIHTGLRPGEWPLAYLETRRDQQGRQLTWLHVVNGKQTNGRGNGTHRTLDISNYTAGTLEAIRQMVTRSQQWALEGKTIQRQSDVAQLFYQVCNKRFPRMLVKYSLHSLRHQFIANMKAVYNDPAKIATLIGDISIGIQSEHYGKRRSSWSLQDIREIPKPLEKQVAQVQKCLTEVEERAHLRMMRKAYTEGT